MKQTHSPSNNNSNQSNNGVHVSSYISNFEDVSYEFDEFWVNSRICKLRCWCLWYTTWVTFFFMVVILFPIPGMHGIIILIKKNSSS